MATHPWRRLGGSRGTGRLLQIVRAASAGSRGALDGRGAAVGVKGQGLVGSVPLVVQHPTAVAVPGDGDHKQTEEDAPQAEAYNGGVGHWKEKS